MRHTFVTLLFRMLLLLLLLLLSVGVLISGGGLPLCLVGASVVPVRVPTRVFVRAPLGLLRRGLRRSWRHRHGHLRWSMRAHVRRHWWWLAGRMREHVWRRLRSGRELFELVSGGDTCDHLGVIVVCFFSKLMLLIALQLLRSAFCPGTSVSFEGVGVMVPRIIPTTEVIGKGLVTPLGFPVNSAVRTMQCLRSTARNVTHMRQSKERRRDFKKITVWMRTRLVALFATDVAPVDGGVARPPQSMVELHFLISLHQCAEAETLFPSVMMSSRLMFILSFPLTHTLTQ